MISNSIFIFIVSLVLVIKGATMATKHAARLAEGFQLSKYLVGFMVVAVISILPETFIAVSSALKGIPDFGLGLLFGSNVADLTLVFSLLLMLAGRKIKIESKILKDNYLYPLMLLVPIFLGLNGQYTRLEGIALILVGIVFYYLAFRNSEEEVPESLGREYSRAGNFLGLVLGMILLLAGAHFTVSSATEIATILRVSPILIAMFVVALGTTFPELFFSLKAIRKGDDGLAVGDILGTVLSDATIVVGLLAVVHPFFFPARIVYVTGLFMVGASLILIRFMRSGRALTRQESYLLFAYWLVFVLVELLVSNLL